MGDPLKTLRAERPTRAFLLVSNDGNHKRRCEADEVPELEFRVSPDLEWRYEVPGEGGVYPSMREWNKIHAAQDYRCGTPCAACSATGYDPLTGKSVAA